MKQALRKVSEPLQRLTRTQFVALLVGIWVAALYIGEWGTAYVAMSRCSWPTLPVTGDNLKPLGPENETRLALVADPQIIDENTYPDRPALLLAITCWITDRYLAKHWRLLDRVVDPDSYVFLGDLFDGGREWQDDKWMKELARWDKIYKVPINKRVLTNVPGNHDVGFGAQLLPEPRKRFDAVFGTPNTIVDLGSHELVLLDTAALGALEIDAAISEDAHLLMERIEIDRTAYPKRNPTRILLTHVPLFRPVREGCGPLREKNQPLPFNRGHQYMTQLEPPITEVLLNMVQPDLIFTGDDHDFCHVEHTYETPLGDPKTAPEFTIKSASMAMGIHKPAVQLLTLGTDGSWATSICFAADPFHPLVGYAILAVLSVVIMMLRYLPSGAGTRVRSSSVGALPTVEYSPLTKPSKPMGVLGLTGKVVAGDVLIVIAAAFVFVGWTHQWMYAAL